MTVKLNPSIYQQKLQEIESSHRNTLEYCKKYSDFFPRTKEGFDTICKIDSVIAELDSQIKNCTQEVELTDLKVVKAAFVDKKVTFNEEISNHQAYIQMQITNTYSEQMRKLNCPVIILN